MGKGNYFGKLVYLLDITDLENYVDKYDFIVKVTPTALGNEFSEISSEISPDSYEIYELSQKYGYNDMLLKTHIRALLYSSLFTTCHSYFENKLIGLCMMYKTRLELDISYNDINGSSDIDKCNLYLKKVLKIKLSSSEANTLWTKINEYKNIRNLVVHNNAKPPKIIKQNEQLALDKNKDKVTITNGELDITDSSFIKDFIIVIKDYLSIIMDEYEEVYQTES